MSVIAIRRLSLPIGSYGPEVWDIHDGVMAAYDDAHELASGIFGLIARPASPFARGLVNYNGPVQHTPELVRLGEPARWFATVAAIDLWEAGLDDVAGDTDMKLGIYLKVRLPGEYSGCWTPRAELWLIIGYFGRHQSVGSLYHELDDEYQATYYPEDLRGLPTMQAFNELTKLLQDGAVYLNGQPARLERSTEDPDTRGASTRRIVVRPEDDD